MQILSFLNPAWLRQQVIAIECGPMPGDARLPYGVWGLNLLDQRVPLVRVASLAQAVLVREQLLDQWQRPPSESVCSPLTAETLAPFAGFAVMSIADGQWSVQGRREGHWVAIGLFQTARPAQEFADLLGRLRTGTARPWRDLGAYVDGGLCRIWPDLAVTRLDYEWRFGVMAAQHFAAGTRPYETCEPVEVAAPLALAASPR